MDFVVLYSQLGTLIPLPSPQQPVSAFFLLYTFVKFIIPNRHLIKVDFIGYWLKDSRFSLKTPVNFYFQFQAFFTVYFVLVNVF